MYGGIEMNKKLYDKMSVWLADDEDSGTMMADWEEKLDYDTLKDHMLDRAFSIIQEAIDLHNKEEEAEAKLQQDIDFIADLEVHG
jgi:hypothetical protein